MAKKYTLLGTTSSDLDHPTEAPAGNAVATSAASCGAKQQVWEEANQMLLSEKGMPESDICLWSWWLALMLEQIQ